MTFTISLTITIVTQSQKGEYKSINRGADNPRFYAKDETGLRDWGGQTQLELDGSNYIHAHNPIPTQQAKGDFKQLVTPTG
jgi:hypothetical protein